MNYLMNYESIDLTEIYQSIFNLPVLKYYRFIRVHDYLPISLPITTNKFSSIEYLVLNYYCTFNELSIIISYTPKHHHLNFVHNINDDVINENILLIILTNLTDLSIYRKNCFI